MSTGFQPAPANPERWKKTMGDLTVIYTKERKGDRVFLYNCECLRGDSWSAAGIYLHLEQDLPPDRVEALHRFRQLVARYSE